MSLSFSRFFFILYFNLKKIKEKKRNEKKRREIFVKKQKLFIFRRHRRVSYLKINIYFIAIKREREER